MLFARGKGGSGVTPGYSGGYGSRNGVYAGGRGRGNGESNRGAIPLSDVGEEKVLRSYNGEVRKGSSSNESEEVLVHELR